MQRDNLQLKLEQLQLLLTGLQNSEEKPTLIDTFCHSAMEIIYQITCELEHKGADDDNKNS